MTIPHLIAWFVAIFLNGIGLTLLLKPELATGPRGVPLLRNESRPMMAVLAAREMVLGLIAAALAYTGNDRGLAVCFSIALLVTIIDAVALYKTRSIFGFVINNLVGLLLALAVYLLWRSLDIF